jgi:hypothetical protein
MYIGTTMSAPDKDATIRVSWFKSCFAQLSSLVFVITLSPFLCLAFW